MRLEQWQPIETAPRDGTRILIACKYGLGVMCGRWQDFNGHGRMAFALVAGRDPDPTHWQPLPEPPANVDAEKGEGS